jgi:hypothetical protein
MTAIETLHGFNRTAARMPQEYASQRISEGKFSENGQGTEKLPWVESVQGAPGFPDAPLPRLTVDGIIAEATLITRFSRRDPQGNIYTKASALDSVLQFTRKTRPTAESAPAAYAHMPPSELRRIAESRAMTKPLPDKIRWASRFIDKDERDYELAKLFLEAEWERQEAKAAAAAQLEEQTYGKPGGSAAELVAKSLDQPRGFGKNVIFDRTERNN